LLSRQSDLVRAHIGLCIITPSLEIEEGTATPDRPTDRRTEDRPRPTPDRPTDRPTDDDGLPLDLSAGVPWVRLYALPWFYPSVG
jgi:hypothetical protein